MKIKITLIAILFCCISFLGNAQTNVSLHRNLSEYMYKVRTEKYAPMPSRQLYSNENANDLLSLLTSYYTDSLPQVRLKSYYLAYKVAQNVADSSLKQEAVMVLVFMLKDTDSGNVGNLTSWLSEFKSEDFNLQAKDSMVSALKTVNYYKADIIKLVAFLGLQDQQQFIKNNLLNDVYRSNKDKWAAHLALARFGEESEIDFCLDMVKKQGVNDDVVYELIPDLIYTRQKKAIDYVIELLHNKATNCTSGNPEYGGPIMCGYRIMEYLAPVIKEFPLEKDASGDLKVKDYKKALKELREWFTVHQSDYEIISNTY